jgi:hypothetical protein
MGAPKIKAYQLPTGYTEAADNDIQQAVDDELIPVKDKPVIPEDFLPLTGVKFKTQASLLAIDLVSGLIQSDLGPDSAEFQSPATGHTDILIGASGVYAVQVLDESLVPIDPSGYTLSASGVYFDAPPSGARLDYYREASQPTTTYIGEFDNWYDGNNWEHRPHIYVAGSCVDPDEYSLSAPSGLVTFNSAVSAPSGTYAYEAQITRYYIGERENWILNHLYMNPDIFRGEFDYPGDDTEDPGGNPIIQGPIPEFVEDSGYQIDFRRGMVTFPDEFDNVAEPAKASYAYLVCVRNVTGQELAQITADPSGVGFVYKALSDCVHPESINTAWIGRNDSFTSRNFYVDGDLKPRLLTVTPYDTLTIKQGP